MKGGRATLAIWVLAIVAMFGSLIYQATQRDAAQQAICREIEKVKALIRDDEIDSFDRLDETLRLLKIKRTTEVVAKARERRDQTLRLFQRRDC